MVLFVYPPLVLEARFDRVTVRMSMTYAEEKNDKEGVTHKNQGKRVPYISAASLKSLVNCSSRASS